MLQEFYYLIAFQTTTDAIEAEKYAKSHIQAAIMPVPREISSGCGLALRIMDTAEPSVLSFFKSAPIAGTLYKLYTRRVDGKHPIEQIS